MTATATPRPRPIAVKIASLALFGLALCLQATPSRAEGAFASPSGKASASLEFKIVVPPVMRVLENSHPSQLQPTADGSALTAEQRLVVVSNMKHGFCVTLRHSDPQLNGWQMQTSAQEGGTTLTPTADGYRLCTSGPGRYTLLFQHAFSNTQLAHNESGNSGALRWPVQTELTAL